MANNPNINQATLLYELTDQDRSRLHCTLLDMYDYIQSVCQANSLVCLLGGGSCLGAIRHKGFIPWDDDLDLMMPRKDYEIFVKLCLAGKLEDKFEFSVPSKDTDSKNIFLKIYKKNTINIELYDENTPFPKGVYIDIFPMDCAPRNNIMRVFKGIISGGLRAISNSVLFSQYPSSIYKKYLSYDKKNIFIYHTQYVIGRLLGIIDHKKWCYWFDRFNASTEKTGYTTIPAGRKNYIGECLPDNVFYPATQVLFEGRISSVPNDYDRYLKNLYGDYMEIPPVNKRERHIVYKFVCD